MNCSAAAVAAAEAEAEGDASEEEEEEGAAAEAEDAGAEVEEDILGEANEYETVKQARCFFSFSPFFSFTVVC